jgi:hypothetical protein
VTGTGTPPLLRVAPPMRGRFTAGCPESPPMSAPYNKN